MASNWLIAIATVVVLERFRADAWSPDVAIGLIMGALTGFGLISLFGAIVEAVRR